MKHYGYISKVKLIVLCLVAMFIVYLALLKSPLNYQHINLGSDELASFEFQYIPDRIFTDKMFSDNGQFMQMVDIPEGINHMISEVIPANDVEYFIELPQLNKPLIYNYNLTPLEMIPSLGLNDSDTTFLNNGGFIQMYEANDETDYIVTEIIPLDDIEYFINPVQLNNPTIQNLQPLDNTEE